MTWDPRFNSFDLHSGIVAEAPNFITDADCQDVISFFNNQNTSCAIHEHTHHTPNNQPTSDFFSWDPSCLVMDGFFSEQASTNKYNNILGVASLISQMKDAATRYTNQPMSLAKVVFHKYTPGSNGPEHTDVWPIASLLYFNDDYTGGDLYFPNQQIKISPQKKSLYIFEGGGDNMHGVKKIVNGYRYVLVAFWEYENKTDLQHFWEKENFSIDQNNIEMEKIQQRYRSFNKNTNVLYLHKFPILEIGNFITTQDSEYLAHFLSINDNPEDDCWGPSCFREYWLALGNDPEIRPTPVKHVNESYLQELNNKIEKAVKFFLETEDIEFSKFKGHLHRKGAFSPPHGHEPASAVAILSLNSDYQGGDLTIPKYDISMKLEPLSLYIFKEGKEVSHGVSLVESGDRQTLVSHWQPKGHPYNSAGAPSRKEYLV
jgi:hypothetical protein